MAFHRILDKLLDVFVPRFEEVLMPQLENEEFDKDAPARKKRKSSSSSHAKVSAETVWNLFQVAKHRRCSLREVVDHEKAMNRSSVKDVEPTTANYWERKLQWLYGIRSAAAMEQVTQLNLVVDGSTHSGKDILVALAYSPQLNQASLCQIQYLPTGVLQPSELNDLSSFVAIAKKSKVERTASFRQIAAINNQLRLLTNGATTLASLKV